MKVKSLVLLVLLTVPSLKSLAQNYNNSIGLSLAGVTGISFNTFLSIDENPDNIHRWALTGMLGFQTNLKWLGIENMIRSAAVKKNQPADPKAGLINKSKDTFNGYTAMGFLTYNTFLNEYVGFYFGPGINFGLTDFGISSSYVTDMWRYVAGLAAIGGVDLRIPNSNINLALSYTPQLDIIDSGKFKFLFVNGVVSLAVRFIVD